MCGVRADGDGTGGGGNPALICDQAERGDDADRHHGQGERRVGNRLGMDQPLDALNHQEHRRAGDEGGQRHLRQRLGLAVAEAMLAVGGLEGGPDRDEIQGRGEASIALSADAEHRHRIGQQEAASLIGRAAGHGQRREPPRASERPQLPSGEQPPVRQGPAPLQTRRSQVEGQSPALIRTVTRSRPSSGPRTLRRVSRGWRSFSNASGFHRATGWAQQPIWLSPAVAK